MTNEPMDDENTISTTARRLPERRLDQITEREDMPDLPLTPREGWTTVLALVAMVVSVGVAIDDSRWAGTSLVSGDSQTGFLPLVALIGVLLGTWLAKSRLSTWRANIVGVLAGSALLLVFISSVLSGAPAVEDRLRRLNESVSSFVNEVFVLGVRSPETSIFLLVMGALVFGAGLFAATSVFRRQRPLPAVALTGVMMLINVSITTREQYAHLVLFVVAALVLLIRLNLREQVRSWYAHGMRDVADISHSFLRGGAVFVALAIAASTVLAANASSAPLSRAWGNLDDELLDVGFAINRWLGGVSGSARGPNILFTPSQTIRDVWQSSTEEVFSATVSDGKGRRWRGATYDSFDGRSWQQLDRESRLLEAHDPILAQTPEAVTTGSGWEQVSATVIPADYGGDVFVAPASPISVDQPSEVLTHGARGSFVAGKLSFGIQTDVPYSVTSLARMTIGRGALTANQLIAAGTNYPRWVERYLEIRSDAIGPIVVSTAQGIRNRLPETRRTPYHLAVAVQDFLYRTGDFKYSTDVRGLCSGERLVDCFLRTREGYCEYFATTMVMMLRAVDVPARYVLGYLPGREQDDGSWIVDRSAAHAWVEVFFPGFGWVEFDPTPGNSENGQQPTRLMPGGRVDGSGDGLGGFLGRGETEGEGEFPIASAGPEEQEPRGPVVAPPTDSWLPVLLVLGLASLLAGLGLWAAVRRIPATQPDLAFNGITRLATRLGHGPRPAQTAYEYAARLGELVPVARSDLQLIATAKVESTYARRQPGESVLLNPAQAYRRVRIGLLRLLLRRPKLGRRPRGPRGLRRR
ncbi:transglutaminaseTgpA domain-containing protein [soil metagenome]